MPRSVVLHLGSEVHDLGYKFESVQPKDDSALVQSDAEVSEEGNFKKNFSL